MGYLLRPLRIENDTAVVPLTRGYEAVVDLADLPIVEGYNWGSYVISRTVYAARCTPRQNGKQSIIYLHRAVISAPPEMMVDHIDGNGLNNRRANLRLATKHENPRNQRLSLANKSGFKGVYWLSESKKWRAIIQVNGRKEHLGLFVTAEEAHAAYAEAAIKVHGKFARAG